MSALIFFLRTIVSEVETNVVMRAGLRLVIQASSHFPAVAHMPHLGWNDAFEAALRNAEVEDSLRPGVDTTVTVRGLILLFIGAQTSSFINGKWQMANGKWQMANGKWQSMTDLAETLVYFLRTSIAADRSVPGAQGDDT